MSRPAKRAPASLRQLQPISQSFGADADGAEGPIASGAWGGHFAIGDDKNELLRDSTYLGAFHHYQMDSQHVNQRI